MKNKINTSRRQREALALLTFYKHELDKATRRRAEALTCDCHVVEVEANVLERFRLDNNLLQ